jgi:hypothetical protein
MWWWKEENQTWKLVSCVVAQGQDPGCKDHFENKFKQVKNYSSYFSSKENK